MTRSIWALALASACVVACSQQPPAQSAAGQAATPAPAAGQAASPAPEASQSQPSAQPATAAPAAVPPAATPSTTSPAPAAAAATPAAQAPKPQASAPPAPTFREVTIPAGTSLSVKLLNSLASNTSKVEDPVKGSIAKSVTVSGLTALPEGTQVLGSVIEAAESGRVKGRASVAFRFDRLVVNGETVRINTASVRREAAADTKSDVKKGGIGAGLGAVVGGVIGGGKGAAIGAVAGGAGTVMATKGKEVGVPAGTVVSALLQDPISLRVEVR
jgi:hypothetical protein